MRKTGVKSHRPEQMLAYKLICQYGEFPELRLAGTEYKVRDIKVVDYIDLTGDRMPTLDIVFLYGFEKIGIRVNGHYHDSRTRKDRIQKLVLEHPQNGWKIVDFWYHSMPNLFSKKPDMKLVYDEVKRELEGVIAFRKFTKK